MHDDLAQLRSGAHEIINDLSSREDSPIFNYVLVVFRDPSESYQSMSSSSSLNKLSTRLLINYYGFTYTLDVDAPFETRNPDELLERLKHINVAGKKSIYCLCFVKEINIHM